jgi:hypothetical protein
MDLNNISYMNNDPGYIWVPYIMQETVQVIDSNFNPKMLKNSRYSVVAIKTRQERRIEKIDKIINETGRNL